MDEATLRAVRHRRGLPGRDRAAARAAGPRAAHLRSRRRRAAAERPGAHRAPRRLPRCEPHAAHLSGGARDRPHHCASARACSALLARFSHAMQINRTHEHIRELQDAFLVLDAQHYVRRPVAAFYRGADRASATKSKRSRMRQRFMEIWEASLPGVSQHHRRLYTSSDCPYADSTLRASRSRRPGSRGRSSSAAQSIAARAARAARRARGLLFCCERCAPMTCFSRERSSAREQARGLAVVEMAERAGDALLQPVRIGAAPEHVAVVVAFEHQRVEAGEHLLDVARADADVGEHAELAPRRRRRRTAPARAHRAAR